MDSVAAAGPAPAGRTPPGYELAISHCCAAVSPRLPLAAADLLLFMPLACTHPHPTPHPIPSHAPPMQRPSRHCWLRCGCWRRPTAAAARRPACVSRATSGTCEPSLQTCAGGMGAGGVDAVEPRRAARPALLQATEPHIHTYNRTPPHPTPPLLLPQMVLKLTADWPASFTRLRQALVAAQVRCHPCMGCASLLRPALSSNVLQCAAAHLQCRAPPLQSDLLDRIGWRTRLDLDTGE